MITITNAPINEINMHKNALTNKYIPISIRNILPECVLFDIETTGFSSKINQCYLIGITFMQNNEWYYSQWMTENKSEEAEIISAFFNSISKFKNIIHFNGSVFDIPFITERCKVLNLPYNFDFLTSIDIFKMTKTAAKLLRLDNYKQKTIEHFLNIQRVDQFTGGELVDVYKQYMAHPDDTAKAELLLHNHDDITGLLGILPILSYSSFSNILSPKEFVITSYEINDTYDFEKNAIKEALITAELPFSVPKRITISTPIFYIIIENNNIRIRSEIYQGDLKFFYPNYKDYYYLPDEDKAIYKSVALYVDKAHRIQAKAATCYTKKTGLFLPQITEVIKPVFKYDYNSTVSYFELNNDFLKNSELQQNYISSIIKNFV